MHHYSSFITLTFDDEHLPVTGSVDVCDMQKFMKRLRKRVGPVRSFYCGEYGEALDRPHYHACIFGFDFFDRVFHSERDGVKLYTSGILSELWPFGFSTVGNVTFESAAYVARYVVKKVNGELADDHYWRLDERTGEMHQVEPEFAHMSRRPGIARGWFDKFGDEVFPSDEVISRGHPCRPPRYYDSLLHVQDEALFNAVKAKRVTAIAKFADNCTPERLRVRRRCTEARVKLLKRSVEGKG